MSGGSLKYKLYKDTTTVDSYIETIVFLSAWQQSTYGDTGLLATYWNGPIIVNRGQTISGTMTGRGIGNAAPSGTIIFNDDNTINITGFTLYPSSANFYKSLILGLWVE